MKTIGIHQGLALRSRNQEPKITILCPERMHAKYMHESSAQAEVLIERTYGPQFAILCREKIMTCLHGLTENFKEWKGSHALFWSPREAHLVKLPLPVEKMIIAADSYHIKPLVEARETMGDFIAVTSFGSHTEVLKVLPTQIEQLGVVKVKSIQKFFDLERAELMSLVIKGMGQEKLPILFCGEANWMTKKANQLSALEGVHVFLTQKKLAGFPHDTFFNLARNAMKAHFSRRRRRVLSQLYRVNGYVERVDGVEAVSRALSEGRAAEIFVADDKYVWGLWNFDGTLEKRDRQIDAEDSDILNEFVQTCIKQKIAVHVVPAFELPNGSSCCALTFQPRALIETASPRRGLPSIQSGGLKPKQDAWNF